MRADITKLARDIIRGVWLVSDPDSLLPIARAFLNRVPLELEVRDAELSVIMASSSPASPSGKARRGVAVIPVHGTMTKYDTCEGYGSAAIARRIKETADDKAVAGIVLDIDSPGGSVESIPPFLEAIRHARSRGKSVYAHADTCGSAAFWLASQCDAIYLDNDLSSIGSVGAYRVMHDTSAPDPRTGIREISVYSRLSSDKNLSYRKAMEGDMGPAMDELDEIVERFRAAVTQGRPGLDREADGVLTGRMFMAGDAVRLGMADAIRTLDETVEAVMALSEIS